VLDTYEEGDDNAGSFFYFTGEPVFGLRQRSSDTVRYLWVSLSWRSQASTPLSTRAFMLTKDKTSIIREAVGIFHRNEQLQAAIDELLSSGFHRADLGLLASTAAVEEKLGDQFIADVIADDSKVPRSAYVSPEAIGDAQGGMVGALVYIGAVASIGAVITSGGTLATIVTAAIAGGGAGGLLGSVLAKWLGDHHANYLQEQIERGGLLLWVRTPNASHEERAVEILKRHSGRQVHVHPLLTGANNSI
jgi:hypothetical protein